MPSMTQGKLKMSAADSWSMEEMAFSEPTANLSDFVTPSASQGISSIAAWLPGAGVSVGVGMGIGVGVLLGFGAGVSVGVGVGMGVEVGVFVGFGAGVSVGVGVGMGEELGVDFAVGLLVGIGMPVDVSVEVSAKVGTWVDVGAGVPVGACGLVDCGVALGCSPSSQATPVIIRRAASPPMMPTSRLRANVSINFLLVCRIIVWTHSFPEVFLRQLSGSYFTTRYNTLRHPAPGRL